MIITMITATQGAVILTGTMVTEMVVIVRLLFITILRKKMTAVTKTGDGTKKWIASTTTIIARLMNIVATDPSVFTNETGELVRQNRKEVQNSNHLPAAQ